MSLPSSDGRKKVQFSGLNWEEEEERSELGAQRRKEKKAQKKKPHHPGKMSSINATSDLQDGRVIYDLLLRDDIIDGNECEDFLARPCAGALVGFLINRTNFECDERPTFNAVKTFLESNWCPLAHKWPFLVTLAHKFFEGINIPEVYDSGSSSSSSHQVKVGAASSANLKMNGFESDDTLTDDDSADAATHTRMAVKKVALFDAKEDAVASDDNENAAVENAIKILLSFLPLEDILTLFSKTTLAANATENRSQNFQRELSTQALSEVSLVWSDRFHHRTDIFGHCRNEVEVTSDWLRKYRLEGDPKAGNDLLAYWLGEFVAELDWEFQPDQVRDSCSCVVS